MKAKLHHRDEISKTITTFWFEPEQPLRFTAGQFTELTIPHNKPDKRGTKRWFSIASSPTHELIAITSKYAGEQDSSSFKRAMFALKPGDSVELAEAMGDFVLPKLTLTPLIFIAWDVGLTPFLSIFEWLIEQKERRNIKFIYAVESEDDIMYQEIFNRAGIHATIIVEKPSPAWGGEQGHLNADLIVGIEEPTPDTLIYLSGPEEQLKQVKKDLLDHGVESHQLVTDFFPGY